MIVSINQPAYLPWLGYFSRIGRSDLHIVLDHVQFEKNSFTNRNKIRTKEGWSWLTVPVQTSGHFGDLAIRTLRLAGDGSWCRKHWMGIQGSYGRAPFFGAYGPHLKEIYESKWDYLSGAMDSLNGLLLKELNITTPLRYSSEMSARGTKSELVLNLCKEAGATVYLSGPLGRNYLDEESFRQEGIEVRYDDFAHPVYKQVYPGFEPGMAAIDLLMNCGGESADILRNANK